MSSCLRSPLAVESRAVFSVGKSHLHASQLHSNMYVDDSFLRLSSRQI